MTTDNVPSKRVCVVGGGPAGALCARAMAERGFVVTLCEAYPHPSETLRGNKAYCIVVSPRGQRALHRVGIASVPGAIICTALARHTPKGIKEKKHPDHPSMVVSRKSLAGYLLDEASKAGVQVKLCHKLVDIDFGKKIASFEKADKSTVRLSYDLLVGCDGSNSIVRRKMAETLRDSFQVRMEQDTMEYQVAVLTKTYPEMARNKEEASSIPFEMVHSWNDRPSNSLCLGFPHEEGGLLFTVIFPGGKLAEFKERDTYKETLVSLLPDISDEYHDEIIAQLKQGKPSTGGTCVWPSVLGSAPHGVVLVGDSGHGMYPSLGQGANCALESAAVFYSAVQNLVVSKDWPERLVTDFNDRRYENAMAAVTLTFNGIGGSKSRHAKNAPVLFMAQVATIMLLHKVSFGAVPKPAMMRLMYGEDECYSSIMRHNLLYEKLTLFGVWVVLPIACYFGLKVYN